MDSERGVNVVEGKGLGRTGQAGEAVVVHPVQENAVQQGEGKESSRKGRAQPVTREDSKKQSKEGGRALLDPA